MARPSSGRFAATFSRKREKGKVLSDEARPRQPFHSGLHSEHAASLRLVRVDGALDGDALTADLLAQLARVGELASVAAG